MCDVAAGYGRWMGECRHCPPPWLHAPLLALAVAGLAGLLCLTQYGHLSAVFTNRAARYNSAPSEPSRGPFWVSIDGPVTKQGKDWVVCKIIKVGCYKRQLLKLVYAPGPLRLCLWVERARAEARWATFSWQ